MCGPPVAPLSVSPATRSRSSSMTAGCTPWTIAVPTWASPCTGAPCKTASLTCHWHHARFDLESGGTFDQFADEARVFPVEIRDGEVWVDLSPREDRPAYLRQRLRDGLERNISLVVAKSAIGLLGSGEDPAEPFRAGLEFGSRYRRAGWGQGLTMHACMMNLLPHLAPEDRPRALYHGLSAVSRDSAGEPPRFSLRPLPERDGGPSHAQGLVPPVRRGARRRRGRALHRLCGARRGRSRPDGRLLFCCRHRPPLPGLAGTSWTSPTRPSKRSTSPDGRMPRQSSPAWPKDTWARGAWRSRTPGATPWIWCRYSRPPSSSCPTR